MGGGLMQLVAYGAQDIYLTGNPQITFFKVVYRRHTNFSMECIQQTWNGSNLTNGRCTATISRNGDLVHKMYIECGGVYQNTTPNPGVNWINEVKLEIGGQEVDKQSGAWMEAWAELTQPNPTGSVGVFQGDNVACGNFSTSCPGGLTLFQNSAGHGGVGGNNNPIAAAPTVRPSLFFNVPLQFWFCRNAGLSLPLIALQYHEVKVILTHTIATTFGATINNDLWCEYIYLDTDERRRFAQVSHEYLIEQVQEQSLQNVTTNELNFNHPVKELIWTRPAAAAGAATYTSLTPFLAVNGTNTYTLKLNGHERFAPRTTHYFSRCQVLQHHSGYGGLNTGAQNDGGNNAGGAAATIGLSNDAIAVYSFALKPEEHQPSGTCNFSRIDNAQLVTNATPVGAGVIFALNYNVLRVMSGMGGLAYSN